MFYRILTAICGFCLQVDLIATQFRILVNGDCGRNLDVIIDVSIVREFDAGSMCLNVAENIQPLMTRLDVNDVGIDSTECDNTGVGILGRDIRRGQHTTTECDQPSICFRVHSKPGHQRIHIDFTRGDGTSITECDYGQIGLIAISADVCFRQCGTDSHTTDIDGVGLAHDVDFVFGRYLDMPQREESGFLTNFGAGR